jgi:hypothetical protein
MTHDRRWADAADEHARAVGAFVEAMVGVPAVRWHTPRAEGRWSAAALALHVCQAYEFGCDAVKTGTAMRLKVPAPVAWISRVVVLPILLARDRFPSGADAPAEVVPDLREAGQLGPDALAARLRCSAADALEALQRAARETPGLRITHAYFGPMPPLQTLRLLSAHTRHHARGLAAAPGVATEAV